MSFCILCQNMKGKKDVQRQECMPNTTNMTRKQLHHKLIKVLIILPSWAASYPCCAQQWKEKQRGKRQHSQVHQLSLLTFFGHTEGLLHWFGPPSIITCIADLKQDSMATTDFFKRPQYACTHLTETTQKQITKSSKVTRRTTPSAQEFFFTMKTNPPRRWEIC